MDFERLFYIYGTIGSLITNFNCSNTMEKDPRWIQRFENFSKALENLSDAVALAKTKPLTKIEKQGLIHAFDIVYDLAWNTVKDLYESKGEPVMQGSRDVFRIASDKGLIDDSGGLFTKIIKSRQLTGFAFKEETADMIAEDIVNEYFAVFQKLESGLEREKQAS